MRKTVTWIIIADGTRARILKNDGPGKGIDLVVDDIAGENRPGRDIMADRPGRSFDRGGQGRHATEQRTDPRRIDKEAFARTVADMVADGCEKKAFDRLVLVAAPKVLGDLRALLPKQARNMVSGEVAKDLTNTPVHDLPDHLGKVLAV